MTTKKVHRVFLFCRSLLRVFPSTVLLLFLSLAVELAVQISFKLLRPNTDNWTCGAEKKTVLKPATGMCVGGNGTVFSVQGCCPSDGGKQW